MARAFAEIAFTPEARAAQAKTGSATACDELLAPDAPRRDRLGPEEAAFVAARDGFHQATVSSAGWPYVQFRGGPRGFLRALDERTLGYADLRGNRQYLSVANLAGDDRVALILMDYAARRRLKILGRARLVDAADDPTLVAALAPERGRAERAILIDVAGFDWNCPAHIPRRFTVDELDARHAALEARAAALERENAALRRALDRGDPGAPPGA